MGGMDGRPVFVTRWKHQEKVAKILAEIHGISEPAVHRRAPGVTVKQARALAKSKNIRNVDSKALHAMGRKLFPMWDIMPPEQRKKAWWDFITFPPARD